MAHFPGTGPEGKICGMCRHFGAAAKSASMGHCNMYRVLMQLPAYDNSPKISITNKSCRHFEPR
jgi:hypothetical protein